MTDDEQEDLEERAAIMEFDGGLSRQEAENLAAAYTLRKKPKMEPAKQTKKPSAVYTSDAAVDELTKIKQLLNEH